MFKLHPTKTKVCSVCHNTDIDVSGIKSFSELKKTQIIKKTTQNISVVNISRSRYSAKVNSLF